MLGRLRSRGRLLAAGGPDRGSRGARRGRSQADVFVPELVAQGEGQRVQGGLRGGVHGLQGHRAERDPGDDVHDVAAALRPHHRQHGADAVQRPVEIQRERLLPVGVRQLVEISGETGAGVVEQQVDSPAAELRRLGDHPLNFGLQSHVAVDPQRPSGIGRVQACGLPGQVGIVDVREDDSPRFVAEHCLRKGQPDARGTAGHDGDLVAIIVFRFTHGCCTPCQLN